MTRVCFKHAHCLAVPNENYPPYTYFWVSEDRFIVCTSLNIFYPNLSLCAFHCQACCSAFCWWPTAFWFPDFCGQLYSTRNDPLVIIEELC